MHVGGFKMLGNFIFSLNIVMPVFVLLLLGYILKKFEITTPAFLASGNKIVFYVALPSLLFRGVYTTDIRTAVDFWFVGFALVSSIVAFFSIWGISRLFIKDRSIWGTFTQGAFRGSFALVGIPLIINLAGDAGMARAALIVAFVVPFFNVFSVMALSSCAEKGKGEGLGLKSLLITIIKNPSNIAVFTGLFLAMFSISLPSILETAIGNTANMATPLALICLGGGMTFKGFDEKIRYALIASLIKVVVLPLYFTIFGYIFGFRGYELATLMVLGGIPGAAVGYTMATQMGGDTYVAGTIVIVTTLLSSVTLTLFIYVMRTIGLLV